MARIENEPVAPVEAVDLTAAVDARAELPPEVLAQSLGEYLRGWWTRVRNGDSGVLPVVIGIVGIAIAFQILNGRFLEPLNLVNLFSQSTIYMVLAMAEIFVLLLGEIDLSVGLVMGLAAVVVCELVQPSVPCSAAAAAIGKCPISGPGWPWWAAIAVTLLICAGIGAIQGSLVARLRMPALVVTLGGSLILEGVTFIILSTSGLVSLTERRFFNELAIYDIFNGRFAPLVGWVALVVVVVAAAAWLWLRDARPAPQRPGGPPGGAHGGQDRRHRRRRRPDRLALQHQPRPRRHHRGGPVHHPDRAGGARSLDPAAAANPIRTLRLRDRRQRRGRPASRGQPAVDPDLVLRPRLGHRRGRRRPLRLLAGGVDQQHHQGRQHLRAAGGGGRGHRRDQPLRWPGQDPARRSWAGW